MLWPHPEPSKLWKPTTNNQQPTTNNQQSLDLLTRHLSGDWGEIPKDDAKANQEALKNGDRIMSGYPLEDGTRIWIITEWDRSVTTFLLPDEY
jgi:hypothetical protein